jgi:ABC-type lipoprotein release transport system permease subunit
MNKRRTIRVLAFVILFIGSNFFSIVYAQQILISGHIQNSDDEPLNGIIEVYKDDALIKTILAEADGSFKFDIGEGNYFLVFKYDDPTTIGYDYLPSTKLVNATFDDLVIQLTPSASILFEGIVQIIETENLPIHTQYDVIEEDILKVSGIPLSYGERAEGVGKILDLDSMHVVVPLKKLLSVRISSSFFKKNQIHTYNITTDVLPLLEQGDLLNLNVREYTIPLNIGILEETQFHLEAQLEDMEKKGFYLSKQRTAQSQSLEHLVQGRALFEDDYFHESFDEIKNGYIKAAHSIDELNSMYRDASVSVYLLILFFIIASLTLGYLISDNKTFQIICGAIFYVFSISIMFMTYPGSNVVSIQNFILFSVFSFLGFVTILMVFPLIFQRTLQRKVDDRVRVRELIIPIFNIAKRSLVRRRLRFILTFISLTFLVMSFVTLTSFSEGYGVVQGRFTRAISSKGVIIRASGWTEIEPKFLVWNKIEQDWLITQSKVMELSAKAENIPRRTRILSVNDQEIWGIIGIAKEEGEIIDIGNIISVDSLREGVLISDMFSKETGLGIGDNLTYGISDYLISGTFNDLSISRLLDLDGSSYLPSRWINKNPEGDDPDFVVEPCAPSEVMILQLDDALEFIGTGVERVAIKVREDDAQSLAESLSLGRGYMSWASTSEGIQAFSLDNYFEGTGLTLIVPWIIVVLNVVITMLNSLYERRKDIEILSSVGLNPAQVSMIFIAEALITGLIAGGVGYLIGISLYKLMGFFELFIQVQQKVSAVWSLASIALSISAVLTGAFVSLRSSVVITPSLLRRWRMDENVGDATKPWLINIPIKLTKGEERKFFDFILYRLKSMENGEIVKTSRIKTMIEKDRLVITFIYKSTTPTTGNLYTTNKLVINSLENEHYEVFLESMGSPEWVHAVGTFLRKIAMEYSIK